MKEKNMGLLFWGGVGTGKSYLAGCIASALMSGFFKQDSTETAADKMEKVLQAEAATQRPAI